MRLAPRNLPSALTSSPSCNDNFSSRHILGVLCSKAWTTLLHSCRYFDPTSRSWLGILSSPFERRQELDLGGDYIKPDQCKGMCLQTHLCLMLGHKQGRQPRCDSGCPRWKPPPTETGDWCSSLSMAWKKLSQLAGMGISPSPSRRC